MNKSVESLLRAFIDVHVQKKITRKTRYNNNKDVHVYNQFKFHEKNTRSNFKFFFISENNVPGLLIVDQPEQALIFRDDHVVFFFQVGSFSSIIKQ